MTLFDYYKLFWQRAFNFTGRSRRKEYWAATLFNSIFIFILFFIFLAIGFIINDYSIFVILYFLYVIFILIMYQTAPRCGQEWLVLSYRFHSYHKFVACCPYSFCR